MASKLGRRIYSTKRWRQKRLEVFERDGWRCTECGKAGRLECHHVKPITSAALWFDDDNLATICRGCHIEKTRKEIMEREKKKHEALEMFKCAKRKEMYELSETI